MGISAKPAGQLNRPGLALPSAVFGIVIVGMITAGAWSVTELDLKATNNRVDAATALRLAHTAETHAVAVLRNRLGDTINLTRLIRGHDNLYGTADDSLLITYGPLGDSLKVTAAGREVTGPQGAVGKYFIKFADDPADADNIPGTDSNNRMMIICRGVTASGSTAEIRVIVGNFFLPALAVDGNLEISSTFNTTNSGACGGIHANGNISGGGTTTVVSPAQVTATGSISHTVNGTKQANATPVDIPDLNPANFCGRPGQILINSGGSPPSQNYLWKPTGSNIAEGKTYCVTGNVEFAGDFGSAASPRTATIIASGSIKLGGKKVFMKAAHADGIVLMGGGDLDMQGDAGFEGMMYAGAQCYISGKPTITGQFVCKNKPWVHPGENWVQLSDGKGLLVSGDATFNFTCNTMLTSSFGVMAWYPTIGT